MKTLLLSINIFIIFSHELAAQANKADEKIKQQVMQLERDWSSASLRHDTATVILILADEYVGIDGRGIISTKADEVNETALPAPGASLAPFIILDESVTDMKARLYGTTAIVQGRVIEKVKFQEEIREIQYRRTTVWVKRQGRWQCVAFHGSRILEPVK